MSSDTSRRKVLLGIGTAATVGLAGCGGSDGGGTPTGTGNMTETGTEAEMTETETEDGETSGTAMVRVSHMSPDAPNVDVYVDGSAVLEDVPFGTTSGYLEVGAGDHDVEITAAGQPDTVVYDDTITVAADTSYTIAAAGEISDGADEAFSPLILEDDTSDPGSDTARLTLAHVSPDAPAVDVTAAGEDTVLFDGVAYSQSGSVEVPAGDYTVQVRGDTDSNDGDVVAEFDVSLAGGEVYTAFASGYLSPDDEPADTPFDLRFAESMSMDDTSDPAMVRVAHMSPDAPNVDVYVDGDEVLSDVAFGAQSGYLEVPAGDRQVKITAAGDESTVVYDEAVTVAAGTAYTVVAAGEISEGADEAFAPLVLEDDNSAPAEGNARLRVVHVSPDAPSVDVTASDGDVVLFDNVPYGESGSTEVGSGTYEVEIRPDSDGNDADPAAEFPDTSLEGGNVYTAYAAGYLSPDDDPGSEGFDLVVTSNAGGM
ncbi:DUF4397 domain-containing protein [Halomicroarcula sp. F28]|uniref:DUF4397 domain-containing protein n=1 Tax=Haloarcula salinisoli TaxID=2487746 RepID=UPI001C73C2F6|nr:DUF4397 domain-containing protein [Halomicroarcula salinisoli]MBX0287525.1 DUF4397 domain-containing protein [Halomicroarcula salinisoli]